MSFQPAVPLSGYAGWKVFLRSADRQQRAFADQAQVKRDIAHFREKIRAEPSSAEIVRDRRLLSVALGAFGLADEIDKRAIIRKVLDEGVLDPQSFANRLNNPKWKAFAAAFGADSRAIGRFLSPAFAADIEKRFIEQSFETAVGEADTNVRLALNFRREIAAIANSPNADRLGWLQVMGSKPLRAVLEAAFNLPSSLARIDIDRQQTAFKERAAAVLGTSDASSLADPDNIELVIRRFFAAAEAEAGAASNYKLQVATTLFPGASSSAFNLFAAKLGG